ncbi:MAG: tetratricopeptide repeat protein [Pseudomonadota bacterium]
MSKRIALHKQDDEHYEIPIEEAVELARGHHVSGNFILAERTYNDVLRATPDNPTVNHLLGAMYFQLGNIEKALDYMKTSIEIEPNEKQYWSNYGSVFYMSEQYDKAIECFDKALALDPAHLESINRKSLALWHQEKLEEAESLARTSLEAQPDNLDGLVNLALSLTKQKKYKEAGETWQQAHKLYPLDVQTLSNWANMLREAHKLKLAEATARKALEINPEDTDVLNNLGCVLRDLGRSEEAIEILEKATNVRPKNHQAHYNKALAYQDLGEFENASIAARYAVEFKDDYTQGYHALSGALVEIGEFNQAHFAAQRAVQLSPESAESYLHLADILYLAGSFDDGHAALKEALKKDPDNPRAYAKLSNIYERLDEADDALWAIDKAIKLAPDNPVFMARRASILHIANDISEALIWIDKALEKNPNLLQGLITKAEILVAVNKNDEAKEVLEEAKKINPDNPLIYFTTANIKKFESDDDPDFKKMLELDQDQSKIGSAYASSLYFALGKAYENLKQYDTAFDYLERANQERRKTIPFDVDAQPGVFESIKQIYSPHILKHFEGKGFKTNVPIFIVGMPRSGTTLTEQIISSHPDVFGAGELPDIMRTKRHIGDLKIENLEEAGKTYLELASARNKSGKFKRITDKMPGNYLNIGLITSILPDAKIIHCCRNPMDTCLSNYKQNFMVGQYWSYNLKELGEEYLRYLDLMEYWHEHLPGKILDINYEDTVNDLETQARKLIDYVGLEWNEACLEPHKQKRAVLTASKAQVTKPVYKSSVEKWKRYEEQLQPLYEIVKEKL